MDNNDNKGKVLVTSGGFNDVNNTVTDENKILFKAISEGKKVLIIANAAPKTSSNYIARENVKENFIGCEASEVKVIDLDDSNLDEILNYDIIYVLGGDLTPLIELNKNPQLKKNILKFLKHGIYIGESAGSIILEDDAEYYYDLKRALKPQKYNVKLDTYACLGLIDLMIYPHFDRAPEDMQEKTRAYELENDVNITRLRDGDIISYSYEEIMAHIAEQDNHQKTLVNQ